MARTLRVVSVGPDEPFTCSRYGCRLAVRHCIERQRARWPGGNRLKDESVRETRAGVVADCSDDAER